MHPNGESVVPGQVDFSMQWRDADDSRLDAMTKIIRDTVHRISDTYGLKAKSSAYSVIPPTKIDSDLMAKIEFSARQHADGEWRQMPSGALHDAANIARLMPVAMLFVPSIGGISHDFSEDTTLAHLITGAQVLATSASV